MSVSQSGRGAFPPWGDKMQYGLYVHGMVTADDDGGTGLDMGGRRGSW